MRAISSFAKLKAENLSSAFAPKQKQPTPARLAAYRFPCNITRTTLRRGTHFTLGDRMHNPQRHERNEQRDAQPSAPAKLTSSRVSVSALAALALTAFATPASAQAPAGYEVFYEAPTRVNLGGRWVVAEIALYADMAAAHQGDLEVALVTDVTEFIEEVERDLEVWVATNQERCGERWGAGDPLIEFPPGAIRFALELDLELWNCGWNGKADPTRYAYEAGKVDVTLGPYVEDGKLQARLDAFSIDEQQGVSKYLPLEFVVRRVLNGELRKLNENTKFYRAPQPFFAGGFSYHSIGAQKKPDGHVVITARYSADGGPQDLDALAAAIRANGITQDKRE